MALTFATLTDKLDIKYNAEFAQEWLFLVFLGILQCVIFIGLRVVICDSNSDASEITYDTNSVCREINLGISLGIISILISAFSSSMSSRGLVEPKYHVLTSLFSCINFTIALIWETRFPAGAASFANDAYFILWIGFFISLIILAKSFHEIQIKNFDDPRNAPNHIEHNEAKQELAIDESGAENHIQQNDAPQDLAKDESDSTMPSDISC
eukprot:CAMPEP_0184872224 /NCGR_PEP_ID=MMETSP0580-20130426/41161_1 /TAXON_ID=1118495 /ORGANISM="Dactyliosolen fragilissimus" /LENGTH=210 /DNA_ID=CAMNT_0027374981 /DNA_START=439 /DNA_END=1071 /DNA_ORIENTATION=+